MCRGNNMPMAAGTRQRLIFVDGLEVWVVGKPRVKNMRLRVQPDGRVEASVPRATFAFCDGEVTRFVRSKRAWIDRAVAKALASPMAQAEGASKEEVRAWRAVVEACVPALVEQWEPILGVHAGQLAYRNMKTRWGSCQPATGRICINVRLALFPPECLEYVVVHELCHLLVAGHGSEFRKLMDSVMPDWKKRRAKLR